MLGTDRHAKVFTLISLFDLPLMGQRSKKVSVDKGHRMTVARFISEFPFY